MSKNKETEKFMLIYPKKKPKTVRDLLNWHIKLFEDCLEYELKKQIIESKIKEINSMIKNVAPLLKEEGYKHGAKLKLIKLNKILSDYKEELSTVKSIIKSFHLTNEEIIGSILQSRMSKERLNSLYDEKKNYNPNILHGDRGWMIEYLAAKEHWDKGEVAFITFGTFLDPSGFDLFLIPNRLDDKIVFKLNYPK